MEILENLPVTLDQKKIRTSLHIKKDEFWSHVETLIPTAQSLIEPRAVYEVYYIDSKSEDAVSINGIRFTSQVLRKQLDVPERVFPYVVTIGPKLEERARASDDLLDQFYLDTIANVALRQTRKLLVNHIKSKYALGGMSSMAPGSLEDWPIQEQRPLFSLLGDVENLIGVRLTSHLLMQPSKSVSGFYYPSEIPFATCQLCPRERCPGRRAAYSEKVADKHGLIWVDNKL